MSLTHELAARANDEPAAAELRHVLAEDLPGLRVADVVVERSARVRHLARAVRAADRPEQRCLDARAGVKPAADNVRRPLLRAGGTTDAPPARILPEGVQHKSAPVE